MATSDVKVTEGSGKNVATHSISEDAETKELQRVVLNDSAGVSVNVTTGDSGQNAQITVPARKEVTFTTTTVQAVGTTDVSNYRWVSVHITNQGTSSTVTFQGSNDNTNWFSIALNISTNVGSTIGVVSTTAASAYQGPINFRYFRLNVTGISALTTDGIIEFFAQGAAQIGSTFVSALSAGTTGPMKAEDAAHASADQGFPAWAIRRDTPVANANVSADGDYTPILGDNLGKTWTAQTQTEDAASASGDRGAFTLGVRNDAAANLTSADADYSGFSVDIAGRQYYAQKSPTATQTSVGGSATNVTLLAANNSRLGATIYNDSTSILYVRLQATATASNFSVKMQPDGYYEVPFGYVGIIDGIWAAATGNARVTEMT